ncbi:nuclear pore complex protein Nup98-Nup96 isoform X2 [Denticeps clupeoides]|uniref:nuclear pore complex protein Nup98-Nup96 isoform X2 n=1 Tax=Denticeps clupeoides TaxID=299321 RepID=UPI0010A2DD77|nr:nuclear pore complex protein Nup98-Nup96 isoform X2 [Denticeps clupeoides]
MFNKSFGSPFGGGAGGFGTTSTFGQQNAAFGAAGGFGSSAFGATNNSATLFGATQNKPGGLFGSSTFSQPVTSTATSGFGFGAASGTSTSLFGTSSAQGGGLFSQQSNAFGANKPAGFGTFGTSTSSGGLFGTTNTTSNPFGGTSGSLFGASTFTATQPGTTIKFNPPTGNDTMVKGGVTTSINTKHQCITAMKEYENKSLEELRLEDYQAGRKGPSNPMAPGTGGLFGTVTSAAPSTAGGLFGPSATNTGFSFNQPKTTFGASTGAFGATGGGLFGQPAASLFKPFGQPTTTQNSGFSFGNTNTVGPTATSNISLFCNPAAPQPAGLFGSAANTSAATGFGAGTGLFGQPTGFGAVGTPNLFGTKSAGFGGTTTTSAPSFGTGGGLFGTKPTLTLGTNANAAGFGFGANTAGGSLFNKTATPLGAGLNTGFGTVGAAQPSIFSNNHNKLGSALGTAGAFGTSGFNAGASTLGFGAPAQPVALTDPSATASQHAALQQQITALTYSPYGDSPLFRNPLSDPKKKEERLKPTNPAAQKALTTPTHYKLTPRPATRVRPKALTPSGSSKAQLFDGLDDDEPSLANGAFMPRKSIKKLVLKNLNGSSLFNSPTNRDTDDLSSPSEYPPNGLSRTDDEEVREAELEDDPEVSKFYTNPIAKPVPHNHPSPALQDTIYELNPRRAAAAMSSGSHNGLEASSEDISLGEDSVQEERDEELHDPRPPHPAGVVLSRVGYYTIPSMEELATMISENGECVVDNFTIGRRGYGSVFFPGQINLTNINLDEIVHFRRKEVIVYPDDKSKPPEGQGLNRRAEVTLDGVWPNDKTTCSLIKSPQRLADMNYEARLERASRKQGARFLEYRPETGSWVFQVAHFSKYGLKDSDEEDDVPPAKTDAKKLKTAPPLAAGLQPPLTSEQQPPPQAQSTAVLDTLSRVLEVDSDMADITQEPPVDSILGEEEVDLDGSVEHHTHPQPMSASCQIASSLGINPHALQIMKASLFMEDDDLDPFQEHVEDQAVLDVSFARRYQPVAQTKVGGLLQTRLGPPSGGLFSHLPEVPFGTLPQKLGKPAGMTPLESSWPTLGPSFLPPAPVPEVTLRTVGTRRLGGPVPRDSSVTLGRGRLLMDAALFAGRSFRVGWGPKWVLAHCGDAVSGPPEDTVSARDLQLDSYGFLPKPPMSRCTTESPFKVHLEQIRGLEQAQEEEERQPLEIQLRNSNISVDHPCPFIQPRPGVQALHQYAQWIVQLDKVSGASDALLGHWRAVWTLCEALWGRLCEGAEDKEDHDFEGGAPYQQQLDRRRSFSAWLASGACARIQEEAGPASQRSVPEDVFSYLTAHRISHACRLAQKNGDHRLALLLSQAVGSQHGRDLLALQLADWQRLDSDSFVSEDRLRVFALLAGKAVWQATDSCVSVCSQLDWQRCVGVHLWYLLPPTASVADALAKYELAFQGSADGQKYACAPRPPYLDQCGVEEEPVEAEPGRPLYDACFHLLKLYSDRRYSLQDLLDPAAVTPRRLDYRLGWHLWNVLQALGYVHLSPRRQGLLHSSYAAQLESAGLWEMAVFVLLHIPDHRQRERAVREMLTLHCPLEDTERSVQKERFLTDDLHVPLRWIHEAKALRARRHGNHHRHAVHLYRAGHWNQCHRLLIQHLASDCIINDHHDDLLEFLSGLAAPDRCSHIQDWDVSGRVFLDYIHVIRTLRDIQQTESPGYELERLHTEVTSLCSRVQLLPCRTAKDRLAQSEMAKRVANILRAVLTLQQGGDGSEPLPIPLCHLAPHIGRLPMPEDYALEELRGLTQSYLRELIITQ